ncbi:MAG: UDP-N-acetylmuramoyl-L-alanyl-D-glutamate--2,6-diaminopimelate ligase [Acidimicrobiales bacterium]
MPTALPARPAAGRPGERAHSLTELWALAVDIGPAELLGEAVVTGITHDSRRVRPGSAFIAVRGAHSDGHRFAADAVRSGASAIVSERVLDLAVPQLVVGSTIATIGPLSAALYGHPSQSVRVVGVTGTDGKTTTCELLRSCIEQGGATAGQIGTIYNRFGDHLEPATLTTPQAPDLQELLDRMRRSGVEAVAMEVSSHALDQHRTDGTEFEIGVFTNLSPEHLDYHGTVEHYWASKARLFEPGRCRQAVIGVDDEWGRRLAALARVPSLTFGRGPDADVQVRVGMGDLNGFVVELVGSGEHVRIRTRLVGGVNAGNVAAAYLAARGLGISRQAAIDGIEQCPRPAGRFEVVDAGQPYLVVVDYAHTPVAIAALVETGRGLVGPGGHVIVVAGARGGRDRFKRPAIGRAVAGADRAFLTTDSPGDEDPRTIIEQLWLGSMEVPGAHVVIEVDRVAAIESAIAQARPGDVVFIVGRGHETVRHVSGHEELLDDRDVARRAIR